MVGLPDMSKRTGNRYIQSQTKGVEVVVFHKSIKTLQTVTLTNLTV